MENKSVNRRRGPDSLQKAIGAFAGISWLLIISSFFVNLYTKPSGESLWAKRYGGRIGDTSLTVYVNILLVLVVIVCFIGFLINMSRHKRKSDRFSKSLIFFGAVSLVWLIVNLISD